MKVVAMFTALLALTGCEKHSESQAIVDRIHNLEIQKMCADQVSKLFREYGYDAKKFDVYMAHYFPEQNKCFAHFSTTLADAKGLSTTEVIYDAFTGDTYGSMTVMRDSTPVPSDHLFDCTIKSPSQADKQCRTR